MARLAVGVVGAVIGFYATGGTSQGAAWGWSIGTAAGAYLFPTQLPTVTGPRLEDLSSSGSAYNIAIPRIYGTISLGGNLVWSPDLIETRNEETAGGKGGGSEQSIISFSYSAHMAVAMAEGLIDGFRRIWFDSELVFDARETNFSRFKREDLVIRLYTGSETQQPDPLIESIEGIDDTPAYRGIAYMVIEGFELADFGNRRPNIRAEIVRAGGPLENTVREYSQTLAGTNFITYDINLGLTIRQDSVARIIYVYDFASSALIAEYDLPIGSGFNEFPSYEAVHDGIGYTRWWDAGGNDSSIMAIDIFTGTFKGIVTEPIDNTDQNVILGASDRYIVSNSIVRRDIYVYKQDWKIFNNPFNVFGVEMYVVTFQWATLLATIDSEGDTVHTLSEEPDSGFLWIMNRHITGGSTLYLMDPFTGLPGQGVVTSKYLATAFDSAGEPTIPIDIGIEADGLWTSNGSNVYDPQTQSFIMHHTDDHAGGARTIGLYRLECTTRHDIDTLRIAAINIASGEGGDSIVAANSAAFYRMGACDPTLYMVQVQPTTEETWREFETRNLTLLRTIDFSGLLGNLVNSLIKFPGENLMSGRVINLPNTLMGWDRQPAVGFDLALLVEDVCVHSGLDAVIDIDVTGISGQTVRGYAITGPTPARSTIDLMVTGFFFDAVESEGKLKFNFKINKDTSTQIPPDDLDARDISQGMGDDLRLKRFDEVQLPQQMQISYIDVLLEYEPSIQYSEKTTAPGVGLVKIALPIVFTSDEGAQIAQKWMQVTRAERQQGEIRVGPKYLALDASDGATLQRGAFLETIDIKSTQFAPNMGAILMEFNTFDIDAYSSTVQGVDPLGFVGSGLNLQPLTVFLMIDAPPLRDIDDEPGFYFIATPFDELGSWAYATVQRKPIDNDEANFKTIETTFQAGFGGRASDALGDFLTPGVWDWINSVNIQMWNAITLTTETELDVLNGANNLFFPRTRELIQFQIATLEADGTYTLTGLLRARKGTEWTTAIHFASEEVVLLSLTNVYRAVDVLQNRRRTFEYKAVSKGASLKGSVSGDWASSFEQIVPRSPVGLSGIRHENGDVQMSWIRRARLNAEWLDDIDVPLDEPTEEYDIDIYAETTLVKTVKSWGTTILTYTQIEQQNDFGGTIVAPFRFVVFQISDRVGRGHGQDSGVIIETYFTDFSEYTLGENPPADWTLLGDELVEFWEIIDTNPHPVNVTNKLENRRTSDGYSFLRWNRATIQPAVDAVIEFTNSTGSSAEVEAAIALRAQDLTITPECYLFGVRGSDGRPLIAYYDGSFTNLTTLGVINTKTNDGTSEYRIRAHIMNDELKMKFWLAADPEPANWDLEINDSTITADGYALLCGGYDSVQSDERFSYFSIAYDGSAAPLP